jgi:magnesium-transporting ATPase (P-type)
LIAYVAYLFFDWMGLFFVLALGLIQFQMWLNADEGMPVERETLTTWWKLSYIREIYFVRSKKRLHETFFAWIGVLVSLFIFIWCIYELFGDNEANIILYMMISFVILFISLTIIWFINRKPLSV